MKNVLNRIVKTQPNSSCQSVQSKTVEPLEESEVQHIAKYVDQSNHDSHHDEQAGFQKPTDNTCKAQVDSILEEQIDAREIALLDIILDSDEPSESGNRINKIQNKKLDKNFLHLEPISPPASRQNQVNYH